VGADSNLAPGSGEGLGGWTQQAFLSRDVNAALDAVTGRVEIVPDQRVTLDVPDLAENGAMAPLVFGTSLQGADSLILVSEPNPFPLIAHFYRTPRLRGTITTRIRMGRSGDVAALISHPMEVGTRRDPSTEQLIARHFIQEIICRHGAETVMSADWGWGVSTNPYLSFQFEGGHLGDLVALQWIDNCGMTETVKARIA
jgi:sulfur-oxidizing protein SoxZ